ncbi:ATP-binding protein [Ignavibacterium sp.]|uniref:sensor histidine kinase n=1 Tax=Ignavibacterium sp. TaxID=2651167 RepID=UPI00307D73F7
MEAVRLKTYFDNPERVSLEEIEVLQKNSLNLSCLQQILEAFPHIALLLNEYRQIVAYNSKAINYFFSKNDSEIFGKRLGEALNCIHSKEMEAGCGTSLFCRECGAAQSIKITTDNRINSVSECRIIVEKQEGEIFLDFRVHTSKITLDRQNLTLFAVEDIQNEKRRQVLERVFFHDVLNTASAIKGIAEVLSQLNNSEEFDDFVRMLQYSADQLIDEIQAQRNLIYAENGLLKIHFAEISINEILSRAEALYKNHDIAKGKILETEYLLNDIKIKTDSTILVRALSNLVKNALEAIEANQKIKIFSKVSEKELKFIVWNEGVIPDSVQLQIFQRSFSTKAKEGRGIGTYSVKLFIEKYLSGKVEFISNKELQTEFIITLYRNLI